MKNIIFIAPPAAGKGTLSEMLVKKYGYDHISTGDLLRAESSSGSSLGEEINNLMTKGEFVSDEVITELLTKKLQGITNNFILDGYPRNTFQADTLNGIFESLNISDYSVIYLNITKQMAMERALGRIVCDGCGKIYHLYTESMLPKVEGICDECGASLSQRNDDNEETFIKRFDTYLEKTAPVIDYYKNKNKLVTVEVQAEKEDTFAKVEGCLND